MKHRLLLAVAVMLACAHRAEAAQQTEPAPEQVAPADEEGEPIELGQGVLTVIPVAVPSMPTPAAVATPAGNTAALGNQIAQVVATNLRNSSLFTPLGPQGVPPPTIAQLSEPNYGYWSGTSAQALVQGSVE
ncbi:MAG TPA: Tol-Pal system protein TolB, partial [Allosphingosinicella sp.]